MSREATSQSPSTVFGVVGEDVVKVEVRCGSTPTSRPARLRPAGRCRRRPGGRPGRRNHPAGRWGRAPWASTGSPWPYPRVMPGFVQPRSGLALRHGVTVLNAPGLIDAGYRDELMVLLVNTDPAEPTTKCDGGDRSRPSSS